jgi:hypothetical protein
MLSQNGKAFRRSGVPSPGGRAGSGIAGAHAVTMSAPCRPFTRPCPNRVFPGRCIHETLPGRREAAASDRRPTRSQGLTDHGKATEVLHDPPMTARFRESMKK